MSSAKDDHARGIHAIREGDWKQAAQLLQSAAANTSDPWVGNDLAVALHQTGHPAKAVDVLYALGEAGKVHAAIRLNRMYMEKALEVEKNFDPAWEHKDHDGLPCPTRPPLVSVIVRTYKRPDLLRDALASLRAQTFDDFETIVINDGGDPDSDAVVKECGLANVRYVTTSHLDRVHALNAGIETAHGKYVTGLDDDDIAYPDHLESQVKYLESPGAEPCVFNDYRVAVYKHGEAGKLEPSTRTDLKCGGYRPGILFETNPVPAIMLMAKKSCYEKVGKFCPNLDLAEDWEMWLRLSEHFNFHHLSAVTAEVRERPGDSNITARRLRQKYYWDNLILYMHRGIILLSEPERPTLIKGYQKAMQMLDELVEKKPEVLPLLNLRGLWTMKKTYSWFADQGRWFVELGENDLSRRFYALAAKQDPFQPKLWAGWVRALKKDDRAQSPPESIERQ